jgi:hypothetical protein
MNTRPPTSGFGTTNASAPVWTRKQQDMLEDLQKNREAAMLANRPPVVELVGTFTKDNGKLADWLIANATAVRNVLRPFDLEAMK